MAAVELAHLTVRISGSTVLDDICLRVEDGELMGVIGESGSGKTTMLRAIAGLTRLTSGRVKIGGVDVSKIEPSGRDVSMMFQKPALLPHRDVHDNVAFPLEVHHEVAADISSRVTAETRALHIESLLSRNPGQLSSGERQLVQMARAMVRTPSVMLLDEPLARLDPAMAQQLRLDLHALQRGYGVTTLLATSDPVETMTMPDRIVVLEGGRIAQIDTPINVYERPATLVAAACTGDMSMVGVRIEGEADGLWLVHPAFRRHAPQHLGDYAGATVVMAMRPAWAHLEPDGAVAAVVTEASPGSGTITVALDAGGHTDHVVIRVDSVGHRRGDRVAFDIDELAVFDQTTGTRL